MSEIYNGSQWAHDIFLVNKAGATEYITGRSFTLITMYKVKYNPQQKNYEFVFKRLQYQIDNVT